MTCRAGAGRQGTERKAGQQAALGGQQPLPGRAQTHCGCAYDEGRAKGSRNFGWDKDFPTPNTSPRRLSSQKGTASAHKRQYEQ